MSEEMTQDVPAEKSKSPEIITISPDEPKNPLKRLAAKFGRRSSILSISRRQSKSVAAGIPFEDQVSAIDSALPVEVRMRRLARLCASATIRAMKDEAAEESGSAMSDALDDLASAVMRKNYPDTMSTSIANEVSQKIEKLAEEKIKPKELVPARVATVRDYTKQMKEEADLWTKMQQDRKDEYIKARSEKRAVVKGEKKLSVKEAEELFEFDEKYLDEFEIMKRVLDQEKRIHLLESQKNVHFKRKLKEFEDVKSEVDVCMEKVIRLSSQINNEKPDFVDTASDFKEEAERFVKSLKS